MRHAGAPPHLRRPSNILQLRHAPIRPSSLCPSSIQIGIKRVGSCRPSSFSLAGELTSPFPSRLWRRWSTHPSVVSRFSRFGAPCHRPDPHHRRWIHAIVAAPDQRHLGSELPPPPSLVRAAPRSAVAIGSLLLRGCVVRAVRNSCAVHRCARRRAIPKEQSG